MSQLLPRFCAALTIAALTAAACAEPYPQPLGRGAVRFFPSEEASKSAPPTFALIGLPRRALPMPEGWSIRPDFSSADGKSVATIAIPEGASLYGLGAYPGPLLRDGFSSHDDPVECPWVMAVRPDGSAFGVVADTSWACSVDLTRAIEFRSEAPTLPVVILQAADPESLLRALNELTGRLEMPPEWALGYRYSGTDNPADALAVASHAREAGVPLDSLSLELTPSPLEASPPAQASPALNDLPSKGLHAVGSMWNRATPDSQPAWFNTFDQAHAWVLNENGEPAEVGGHARMRIPDLTTQRGRDAWESGVGRMLTAGYSGLWIQRLVPPSPGLPGNWKLNADQSLGGPATLAQDSSLLNRLEAAATREAFRGEQTGRRPVVLAAFSSIGLQQSAATQIVEADVPTVLSLTLSGQSLVDVPWRPTTTRAGLDAAAQIGIATLVPMLRGTAPPSAPANDPETNQLLKTALARRSRLIPYFYTLCFNAFSQCDPMLRPIFFADPRDPSLRSMDSMFLLGRDVLVIPHPDAPAPKPPLKGAWRRLDFADGNHPELPDVYIRPGAILPLGPVMQHTGERPLDPLTLVINPDESGAATGELFEDEGDGYDFYHNGCRRIVYKATTEDGSVLIRLATLDGGWPIPKRRVEIRILTDSGEITGSGSERGTIKIDLPAPKAP